MAFHFEKPSGFNFKAGLSADVTLTNPPDTDAEGNSRTFSIASPPFENELIFTTCLRVRQPQRTAFGALALRDMHRVKGIAGSFSA